MTDPNQTDPTDEPSAVPPLPEPLPPGSVPPQMTDEPSAARPLAEWFEPGLVTRPPTDEPSGASRSVHNATLSRRSDGVPAFEPPADAPHIPGFAVLRLLARGAASAVYLAEDEFLRRQVVLKVLRPTSVGREWFRREAVAAAAVRSDHVMPLLAAGETADGTAFLVMPYLPGEALSDRLASPSPIPLALAVRIGRDISDGLTAVHAAGLVHRDIKPNNVWLEGDPGAPRCRILDFGLAVPANDETEARRPAGTPAYMSPEQAEGRPVDARTDLWSLGATLYRLTTGVHPFRGPNPHATLVAVRTADPRPVREVNPAVPPNLGRLIERLLRKERDARPNSAAEVATELRAIERRLALADSSIEFELGGSDASLSAVLRGERSDDSGAALDAKHDIFETDFEIPALPDESASGVAAREPVTGPDGSDFELALDDSDAEGSVFSLPRADAGSLPDPGAGIELDYLSESFESLPLPDWPTSGRATGAPPSPPPSRPRVLPNPPEPDPPRRGTAAPRPITDAVHFSVTAPAAMRDGSAYVLSVWAHLAAQRDEVLARAQQAHPLEPVQMQSKGPVRVARGTVLTVQLWVPTLAQPEPAGRDAIEWDGDIGTATFPVTVPPGAAAGGHSGTVTVYAEGFEIARLDFTLQVAPTAAPAGLLDARQVRHRRAFASYATRDRDAVLARIQGLQKALPDLDIFFDVASLRAGDKWAERLKQEIESRDVFYLFWSRNAQKSEWVEREWRLALAARGIGYIDPVPLADPRAVPPPPELAAELHFNDWVLAYMSGAGAAAPGRGSVAGAALVVLLVLFAVLGVVVFVLGGGSGK